MKALVFVSLCFFIAFPAITIAQTEVEVAWIRHFGQGTAGVFDFAVAVVHDDSNNVIVAGGRNIMGTGLDCIVIKYAPDGTQRWVAQYDGPDHGDDEINALAVDKRGNVCITGTSENADEICDFLTIKYSPGGQLQWVARFDGTTKMEDDANAIAIDADGNTYVAGLSGHSSPVPDMATIKYNSNGVLQWVAYYEGPGKKDDSANAIALDSQGNVVVAGTSWSVGSKHDFVIVKYNRDGIQQWVDKYNGPGNGEDMAVDLALDVEGNLFVAGNSEGVDTASDLAVLKYNQTGVRQWVVRYNGAENLADEVADLEVDLQGNAYVTGTAARSLYKTNSDFVTIKVLGNGTQKWVARYNGPGDSWDKVGALTIDSFGNVFVTGQSNGIETSTDYATICYDKDGIQQWIDRYTGAGKTDESGVDVSIDDLGDICVTGATGMTLNSSRATTIKYFSGDHANPVELSAFTAHADAAKITLYWKTESETNCLGFEVRRSNSPIETEGIRLGFVAGFGTTNAPNEYSYVDSSIPNAGTYYYRLRQMDTDGTYGYSATVSASISKVTSFSLSQNYPNPFNDETVIRYQVPKNGMVSLRVYNTIGEEIAVLVDKELPTGQYEAKWVVPANSSGIYFYRLQIGNYTETRKTVLLR